MGQRIIRLIQEDPGIVLTGALERNGHPDEGRDAGELAGIGTIRIPLVTELPPLLSESDVVIDFSSPSAALQHADEVTAAGRSMVIGTTGLTTEGLDRIRLLSERIPILLAPNMSLGVNLLFKLAPLVAGFLGDDYDVEIIEAHHHFKKDAPSGTAVKLAEVIAKALKRDPAKVCVYGRRGIIGERDPEEIGVHAVRGGDIVGDHRVMFCGTGERVELVHKASSRDTFAKGAIRAAKWIVDREPGLYSMLDLLDI